MTAYGARGLPIGVYRLIGTFQAYEGLSRWSCVLFVPVELMGAWLGCCLIIFVFFRFSSGLACLSKILISLRDYFWYIMILAHLVYSLSYSVHYFVLTPHCLGGAAFMHACPDRRPSRPPQQ